MSCSARVLCCPDPSPCSARGAAGQQARSFTAPQRSSHAHKCVCVCVGTNMLPPPQNQWQKNRCDKWLRALGLWETRAESKPKLSLQKEKANISGRKDWQPKREKAGSWDTTGSQQWTTSCTWTASVLQRSGQGAEIPICKHTSCRSGQTAAVRPQPGERGRQDSREGWWWRECMMHTRLGASTQHSSDQPGWRDRRSA